MRKTTGAMLALALAQPALAAIDVNDDPILFWNETIV
jgi:hypothetical protein